MGDLLSADADALQNYCQDECISRAAPRRARDVETSSGGSIGRSRGAKYSDLPMGNRAPRRRIQSAGQRRLTLERKSGRLKPDLQPENGASDLARAQCELFATSTSPVSVDATSRLAALDQGGVLAVDIKKLRAQAGTHCLMCHAK
jgi:hypothetical protein